MTFKQGWYLLYTRPKHERRVIRELDKLNIPLYHPTTNVLRQWHDRTKMITIPLFPSYVFVYLDNQENYYKSRDVDGAISYVRFGKEIALISEKVINNLRFLVENGQDIEVTDNKFNTGQQLTITEGLFTGFTCEMVEYKNKMKVLVRINILNRAVHADIPILHLAI